VHDLFEFVERLCCRYTHGLPDPIQEHGVSIVKRTLEKRSFVIAVGFGACLAPRATRHDRRALTFGVALIIIVALRVSCFGLSLEENVITRRIELVEL
jgi:hypothetical protein